MDNFTHSIAAWALARAGLERQTPYATAALIIGANMPDLDVFAQFTGGILSYLHTHRGNTHSLLGVLPQAIILTVALGLINHTVRRKKPEHPQIRAIPLLMVSALGLLSHLLMDFPNNYGIRLFLPFSNRWSYGDFMFVVDPWLFLILAGALFLGSKRDFRATLWWAIAGAILTLAVLLVPYIDPGVKGVWLIGIGILIALRVWIKNISAQRYIQLALTLAIAYYAALFAFKWRAGQILAADPHAGEVIEQSVTPLPGNIFQWAVFRETEEAIRFGQIGNIFTHPQIQWQRKFPKNFDDPFVRAALGTCTGQVLLEFSRYPAALIREEDAGSRVTIFDTRYVIMFHTRGRDWARAGVIVHDDLTTEEPEPCPLE
jgi:inner membrane protein